MSLPARGFLTELH